MSQFSKVSIEKLKLDKLLEKRDENNTYLDYLLEDVKNGRLFISLDRLLSWFEKPESIAKFYLILAKHDMMQYISKIDASFLTYKLDGSTVLDMLLDSDEELTFNKILNDEYKRDIEVAVILKKRGFNTKYYNVYYGENMLHNYEQENNNRLGIGPVFSEGELLLNRLYELFKSDTVSNNLLTEVFINSYKQALIANHNVTILELKKLIEIKEKNMKRFVFLDINRGAYFDIERKCIYSSKLISNVLYHEAGHALHVYSDNEFVPENLYGVLTKTRENPEVLKQVEIFAKKYKDIKSKVDVIVNEECEKYFKNYYSQDKIKYIKVYLNEFFKSKRERLISLGFDEEIINKVLFEALTIEEYINHQKRVFKEEYTISYMRIHYGNLVVVSDILDALYEGKLSTGKLVNKEGTLIQNTYGHGISYYSDINYLFTEMIADYAAIVKSNDGKEYLDLLHSIIGDELYNLIVNYYEEIIKDDKLVNEKVKVK